MYTQPIDDPKRLFDRRFYQHEVTQQLKRFFDMALDAFFLRNLRLKNLSKSETKEDDSPSIYLVYNDNLKPRFQSCTFRFALDHK